jgi:hypothetical protein
MLSSASSFVVSSIPLYNNAIKSLIFRCAGLLVTVAVYKISSLIAAIANLFTSYLMFAEGYIQRGRFIYSRGLFSRNGILVFVFTIAYVLADFYGTILWAIDSPGYVLRDTNKSLWEFDSPFLDDPAYIVYVTATPSNVGSLQNGLQRIVGANLFKPSLNLTLTETVSRGRPEIANHTQPGAGGRVWLDDEGLSMSPDTRVMVSYKTDESGQFIGLNCPAQLTATGWGWNCTFNNTYVQPLLNWIVGLPEVHWDDASDLKLDSRYIRPNPRDNIWAAYGQGGGTAVMKQVLIVTKGNRRHTFLQTVFRCTMVTTPLYPFALSEVDDLLRRTWSTNASEQHHPLLASLSYSIDSAQAQNQSFLFGLNSASNLTTTQVTWEYLTWETNRSPFRSFLRIITTNITLIRSETLPSSRTPIPFNKTACSANFMNVAYGGRVTETDCTAGGSPPAGAGLTNSSVPAHFFGQVDTAAVLILYGLGDGRSNLSAAALDETVWEWATGSAAGRMDALLLARGFAVSVDPALVTVTFTGVVPAAAWLQIALVLLAAGMAAAAWAGLACSAGNHWASTLFWNLVETTAKDETTSRGNPRGRSERREGWLWRLGGGCLANPPDVTLTVMSEGPFMAINGRLITLASDAAEVTHASSRDGHFGRTGQQTAVEWKTGENVASA